jgi:hypothetical protein
MNGMELAPSSALACREVAKASQGHDPLPFLISDVVKNWCKDIGADFYYPNKIFIRLICGG